MFLPISFLSALAGVGFAGAAALLADTGVDGTPGAFLALTGTIALCAVLGLMLTGSLPALTLAPTLLAVLLAILTGLAAWFLMLNPLIVAMLVSALAVLANRATAQRRVT